MRSLLSTLTLAALAVVIAQVPHACAQRYSDWSAPVNLGAIVNSTSNDQHPALSKDGLTLIFASDRPGSLGDFDLWVSQRDSPDDPWTAPVNLTMLNTPFREYAPNFSTDGHWLYFHSNRPGGCGDQDIYAVHRQNKRDDFGWETPVNLGCVINTAFTDAGPTFFEDASTGTLFLYFNRNLTPANMDGPDIYVSTCTNDIASCNTQGLWGVASLVTELSSPVRDTRTAVRVRDGLEMILASNRPGGQGSSDLWVSTRATTQDPWSTPPVNLGPVVNSAAFDGAMTLSWDATEMIFYSTRPGGSGLADLYVTRRTKITGVGN